MQKNKRLKTVFVCFLVCTMFFLPPAAISLSISLLYWNALWDNSADNSPEKWNAKFFSKWPTLNKCCQKQSMHTHTHTQTWGHRGSGHHGLIMQTHTHTHTHRGESIVHILNDRRQWSGCRLQQHVQWNDERAAVCLHIKSFHDKRFSCHLSITKTRRCGYLDKSF